MYSKSIAAPALPAALSKVLCLNDFYDMARRKIPAALYAYVSGYSEDGLTHQKNLDSFKSRSFFPRVLVDVTQRDLRTSIFGVEYAAPFGIAPMGFSRLIAADGDIVLAKAAARANVPFILSGASLTPLETVRTAGATSWFQAYIPGDTARIDPLLARVEAAGFDTLVVNVDTAVHPQHEFAERRGFKSPVTLTPDLVWQALSRPAWTLRVLKDNARPGHPLRFENMDAMAGPPIFSRTLIRDIGQRAALNWTHIERIRQRWRGKLVLKGVMAAPDAVRAERSGVDGIIVSNHGGRQIDCAASSLDALDAIAGRISTLTVMYDGGVRRGADVMKAIRSGAKFVFVGRPFLLAAAAAGDAGADHALTLMRQELSINLGLLGINRIDEVMDLDWMRG